MTLQELPREKLQVSLYSTSAKHVWEL